MCLEELEGFPARGVCLPAVPRGAAHRFFTVPGSVTDAQATEFQTVTSLEPSRKHMFHVLMTTTSIYLPIRMIGTSCII